MRRTWPASPPGARACLTGSTAASQASLARCGGGGGGGSPTRRREVPNSPSTQGPPSKSEHSGRADAAHNL
eukprot:4026776-Pleurochrysis_carterae.AAC.1